VRQRRSERRRRRFPATGASVSARRGAGGRSCAPYFDRNGSQSAPQDLADFWQRMRAPAWLQSIAAMHRVTTVAVAGASRACAHPDTPRATTARCSLLGRTACGRSVAGPRLGTGRVSKTWSCRRGRNAAALGGSPTARVWFARAVWHPDPSCPAAIAFAAIDCSHAGAASPPEVSRSPGGGLRPLRSKYGAQNAQRSSRDTDGPVRSNRRVAPFGGPRAQRYGGLARAASCR